MLLFCSEPCGAGASILLFAFRSPAACGFSGRAIQISASFVLGRFSGQHRNAWSTAHSTQGNHILHSITLFNTHTHIYTLKFDIKKIYSLLCLHRLQPKGFNHTNLLWRIMQCNTVLNTELVQRTKKQQRPPSEGIATIHPPLFGCGRGRISLDISPAPCIIIENDW